MTTATAEQAILDAVKPRLYIGGEWRDGGEGATLGVEDPATGETLIEVADATVDDAKDALGAAHEAFAQWRDTAPRERGDILRRAYELITERADELALLMTLEMGKPVAESKAEIAYAANFFRWYAEEAVRIDGRFTVNEAGAGRVLTLKQPVGPCLFITPWNFPLAMGTRKIGPAIAAGCTMVVKPAKQTPLSMLMLAQILEEVGLPGGVLNVITAQSSGRTMEPLIKDPRTRKLSFTGSTEVGRTLIQQSADQILRVSMELGGNAPFLIFDDADLDAAVEGALIAKMRNGGEACTSANRFHVADGVAQEFAEKLAAKMGAMKVGRGTEPDVKVGPLIDDDQRGKVAELVDDARERGAKVAGRRLARRRRRLLLRADRARRRARRRPPARRGDLRAGRPGQGLRLRRGGDRRGQRHRVRARRLRLHAGHQPRLQGHRRPRDRDDRPQPGHGLQRWRARSAASSSPASAARAAPRASRSTSRPSTWR